MRAAVRNVMTWTFYPAKEFAKHAASWQAVNRAGPDSPLLHPDFVTPLLAQFATGSELLGVYRAGPAIEAMAIVKPHKPGVWETFQPSQAPLGMWVQSSALEQPVLMAEMVRQLPGLTLIMGATQQDPDLSPRPADSGAFRTMDYIQTARITITGSFDDYWSARGKNLRSNLKKQRGKLLKDGVATRLEISRAAGDMASAVADYGKLESAGWKASGGTAIHPDNVQGRFYQSMLENFCSRGCGSVYRYWFDDQLVAMDLCVEGDDSIIVLKTTYDESVPNSLSPTLLMREDATRHIFTEGRFAKLEFYGKVMEWHTKWTDEVRTMYHTTGYRWPGLLGLLRLKKYPMNLFGQLRAQRARAL